MHHTGTLFMSKTRPEIGLADGAFALTLLLLDNLGAAGKEAYRVRWTGPQAQAFWQAHQGDLVPGAVLRVELEHLRAHVGAIHPPMPELRARVISAEICPKRPPAVREKLSKQEQPAHV